MKQKITESLEIPSGMECKLENKILICTKNSKSLARNVNLLGVNIELKENKIIMKCMGNKSKFKLIKSYVAHFKNMFKGLEKEFVYKLEICNVHFPMNAKIDKNELIISNFLGEKKQRKAKILPNVKVKIQGNIILVSSNDKEAAGQTAANFEKITKIRNRDRRVFQDGIYITEKAVQEVNE